MIDKSQKTIEKAISDFEATLEKKGSLKEMTDSQILKLRDKYRKIAVKHRGSWTFEFYETLQSVNKESIKRGLDPETKHD